MMRIRISRDSCAAFENGRCSYPIDEHKRRCPVQDGDECLQVSEQRLHKARIDRTERDELFDGLAEIVKEDARNRE